MPVSGLKSLNAMNSKSLGLITDLRAMLPSNKVIAEYVWIGGSGQDLRNKTRIINKSEVSSMSDLPIWSFDGSSTGQAPGTDSEVLLRPVRYVPCPFRGGKHIIVLCETFDSQWNPIPTNRRAFARQVFETEEVTESAPMFGLEQEYTLFTADGLRPLGFPMMGNPMPQGQYYCATGVENAFGRHLSEAHLFACMYAGLEVSGTNAEVMPGQWEYQIGPVIGIDAADQLWIARFIMQRIGEELECRVSLDPKPMRQGDWNGAGCHCNFSTKDMRDTANGSGLQRIFDAIKDLEPRHMEHMELYGTGNEFRMTGLHETARFDEFSYGVANRGCSIRVTRETEQNGGGHMEDRRPSANCDPYNVTAMLCKSIVLEKGKGANKAY
mmetsp:Transcript_63292/g.100660  ORF Transcript_63292/g.100660 Transcript_63292/m.100660 type:complete len:382 (+) Transcript_63292:140-1285(+)